MQQQLLAGIGRSQQNQWHIIAAWRSGLILAI
jgi:hypothetical protein